MALYEFASSGDFASSITSVNYTPSNATLGISPTTNTASFTSGRIEISNTDYIETASAALADGQYLSVTLTSDLGFLLTLDTFSMGHARSNSAPRQLAIYAATNGSSSFTSLGTVGNANSSTLTTYTRDLTTAPISFVNLNSVEFRMVWFDDNATPGVARYDNITISGDVAAIPEPSTYVLVGVALGSLWLLRRRRFRAY
ncbi:MAG: PEP-CTERM sorting domain-containing protein [Blastochloris sp.]|nr:PEP-CTERM sorting domain-containing protein [Blastochloris sp.]